MAADSPLLTLSSAAVLEHWQGHRRLTRRVIDTFPKQIDAAWPKIPPGRFGEIDKAFGEWEGPVHALFLYWIANETHDRGQGYVYLRALDITPHFFDRS